jgi:hypothetical protein
MPASKCSILQINLWIPPHPGPQEKIENKNLCPNLPPLQIHNNKTQESQKNEFLKYPKKDPMTPKARCKAWTTQTQNRKGGGEKKAPERERERERERVPPHLSTYLLLQGKALKKKASTFTRTETTQSSLPLVWFSLLNSS